MQNEESVEKIGMIDPPNYADLPQSLTDQSQVYRLRKVLLILLVILFVFDLIYLIFVIHAYIDNSWLGQYYKNNYELLWTLVSIIYDVFGLLVTYRYYSRALSLFAWIGTICLVLLWVVIGVVFVAAFFTIRQVDVVAVDVDITGPIIFMIMFVASSVLLLIIVLLSFKLSKLITNNRHIATRPI